MFLLSSALLLRSPLSRDAQRALASGSFSDAAVVGMTLELLPVSHLYFFNSSICSINIQAHRVP
jgi:hypothetical protein